MAGDNNQQGPRQRSDTSMGRAMDLHWAESFSPEKVEIVPIVPEAEFELVIVEEPSPIPEVPFPTATPEASLGPIIDAVLVEPQALATPAPIIEAELVAPTPTTKPAAGVPDWLADVSAPGTPVSVAVPPAEPKNTTPDWLSQIADAEAPARPAAPPEPPPGAGVRPDWLDQLG